MRRSAPSRPRLGPLCVLLAAAWPLAGVAADEALLGTVEVIGTSPLPGQGVDRALLPYGTQVVRRAGLDQAQADTLTDHLARRMAGAQVSDIQGSPYQAELSYRGYRASGLLGAAQGLSVFLDGVRINEPFGDVVNWDMLPEFALRSLSLVPGANPAFGLNTLGGALAFETASGQNAPGGRAELSLGSGGRQRLELGWGRQGEDGWHQYLGASLFSEDGWRDHSDGHRSQVFLKLGRDTGDTRWHTSLLLGRSTLVGNGLTPAYTLQEDSSGELTRVPDLAEARRAAVYTHPDQTRNELAHWQFNLQRTLATGSEFSGLVYLRRSTRDTVNGDVAEVPDGSLNAALNTSATRQTAAGLAASLAGRQGAHQWQVGLTLDTARVRFRQDEQEGFFTADRGVSPGPEDAELSARVQGHSWNLGLFASDTWRLAPGTHLTAALRGNLARVRNQLDTVDDASGVLDSQPEEAFRYRSLNPALGLRQQLGSALSVFANLARNTRVPTVIELGCADPAQPCRLPAGLQSDPYLKQVRATSLEAGLRWQPAPAQTLGLSLYRNDNRDDIVFGSVSSSGQLGYFRNVARTRHQGLDLSWEARLGAWSLQAAWSHLQATYEASETLRFGNRNVSVQPGTRMAGLPRNQLKLGLDWQASPAWSLGADWQAVSRRGTLGNEDGLAEDGASERVDLSLPGFALLNLRAAWKPGASLELFARVGNLLNRRSASYGALGETLFDASGAYTGQGTAAVFIAPGAPRSLQLGGRLAF